MSGKDEITLFENDTNFWTSWTLQDRI